MKRRNENFTATVSKLLELKANPDIKEITGKTAKVFAEKKIEKAVDYSFIDTYDYYYFKDEFSNCDCASTKRIGDYDVIVDIDWENCYECDAPCYFDWPSLSLKEDATEDAENADNQGNAEITDSEDADGADYTELSGKSSNSADDSEVLENPNDPP